MRPSFMWYNADPQGRCSSPWSKSSPRQQTPDLISLLHFKGHCLPDWPRCHILVTVPFVSAFLLLIISVITEVLAQTLLFLRAKGTISNSTRRTCLRKAGRDGCSPKSECFSHQVCCLPHPTVVPVPPHLLFYSDYVSSLTGFSYGWTLPFPSSVFHIIISLNQLWLCLVSVSQHFLRCGVQTPWADTALWLTCPFPLFQHHLHITQCPSVPLLIPPCAPFLWFPLLHL